MTRSNAEIARLEAEIDEVAASRGRRATSRNVVIGVECAGLVVPDAGLDGGPNEDVDRALVVGAVAAELLDYAGEHLVDLQRVLGAGERDGPAELLVDHLVDQREGVVLVARHAVGLAGEVDVVAGHGVCPLVAGRADRGGLSLSS